jgi:hypothetical protein
MSVSLYGSGQTVLQVVQGTYSAGQSSTTSASFVTTGLTASITPQSTTSKILVLVTTTGYSTSGGNGTFTIYRNSTNLGTSSTYGFGFVNTSALWTSIAMSYLDSPATTSSTVYTVYFLSGSGTVYTNIANSNSVITLLEISGS